MKKMTKIGTAIASLLMVGMANAATPGAYVGLGLGDSVLRTSNMNTISGPVTSTQHRGGIGGQLFGGYNFNNYLGLEGGYATYASSKYTNSNNSGAMNINTSMKYSLDAVRVVGKAYLPLGNSGFDAYALGGVAEVRNQARFNINTAPVILANSIVTTFTPGTTTTRALRPTYGLGVNYGFADQHINTGLEVSRIAGKGNLKTDIHAIPDADMVSLNLGYNFG